MTMTQAETNSGLGKELSYIGEAERKGANYVILKHLLQDRMRLMTLL